MSETAVRPQGIVALVRRHERVIRVILLALIFAGGLLIVRRLPLVGAVRAHQEWLRVLGPWAPLAFGLVYAVAVVFLFPAAPLTVASGALFGVFKGTLVASLASTTGAAVAFLIARGLGRQRLAAGLAQEPNYVAIDRAVAANGWKIVALLRLSPVVPFNLQNYAYGLTGIGFWPCVLTSWAAMLPGTILYASLGTVGWAGLEAATDEQEKSTGESFLTLLGVVATAALALYVGYLAKRAVWEAAGRTTDEEAPLELEPRPVRGALWKTALLAVVALVVACAAGLAQFRPELFRVKSPAPAPYREPVPVHKKPPAPAPPGRRPRPGSELHGRLTVHDGRV